jgi:hypothetical protein
MKILFDIICHGRVIEMYMAENADEAIAKYHKFRDVCPRLNDGLYGYPREGGKTGVTAKPSF